MNLKKEKRAAACLLVLFSLVSCGKSGGNNPLGQLEGLSPAQALERANAWHYSQPEITSYLLPDRIIFEGPEDAIRVVELPKDQTVIAIAPFLENTHPCAVHYMSSCRGELPDTDFTVRVRQLDGDYTMSGEVSTLKNGFMELWLPAHGEFEVEISRGQYSSNQIISTTTGSNTCITTMQLKQI